MITLTIIELEQIIARHCMAELHFGFAGLKVQLSFIDPYSYCIPHFRFHRLFIGYCLLHYKVTIIRVRQLYKNSLTCRGERSRTNPNPVIARHEAISPHVLATNIFKTYLAPHKSSPFRGRRGPSQSSSPPYPYHQ
jgi:hypothetical protein